MYKDNLYQQKNFAAAKGQNQISTTTARNWEKSCTFGPKFFLVPPYYHLEKGIAKKLEI